MNNINEQIEKAIEQIEKVRKDYFDRNKYTHIHEHIEVIEGKRYFKFALATDNGPIRYVYCFVDKVTGDILKPACWDRPAQTARGNIFDESTWICFEPHGVTYLRR